jgi:hypothetical protein
MKSALPGTRVRLTGKYLRNTGQYTGSEGQSRWIVQACDCSLCKGGAHVATDEPGIYEGTQRHIALANLRKG